MLNRCVKLSLKKGKSLVKPNAFLANRITTLAPSVTSVKFPVSNVKGDWNVKAFSTTNAQTLEFQAETRKLLDIVTHSIYTDKEVFLRELISNASDSLEKFRYNQNIGKVVAESGESVAPLEINIICDQEKNTLTITDNGIGMSKDELISNLGTIARSGSKAFVEQVQKDTTVTNNRENTDGIIGQFGVGFYSSFMVSDTVSVESISATTASDATKWFSDGSGQFQIEAVPEIPVLNSTHGSKITMKLKDSCKEYSDPERIKAVIKRYSNFVAFPIKVDGEVVNTVSAIWTQDKKTVTEAQYDDFYRFIANAYDKPKFRLHFRTDAPIDLKCLFYIPSLHSEKFGNQRTELGVNLYSRKVLIESKPKDLLPDWLRFVKGAVDSEDLPLSLSREKPQDSNLLRRIKDVLTRKMLRFLEEQMKNKPADYKDFWIEYQMFIKEGICHDYKFIDQLSKLLLFESSAKGEGEMISLDDYISRCDPEQKHIYYLVAPNREGALKSPYYETFKKHNKEVLLLYNTIDDFVMSNMKTYAGRTLTSAETSSVDLGADSKEVEDAEKDKEGEEKEKKASTTKLSDAEAKDMCEWLTLTLGVNKVKEVKVTNRLYTTPAIVTDHESGALRRMMKMVEQANAGRTKDDALPPQVLEVNPSHPLIVALHNMKDSDSVSAGLVAEQVFDNALISAGLIEDSRYMIPRLNEILLATLTRNKKE